MNRIDGCTVVEIHSTIADLETKNIRQKWRSLLPHDLEMTVVIGISLLVAVIIANISVGLAAGLVLGTILTLVGITYFEVLIHALIVLLPLQSTLPYSLSTLGTLNPFNLLATCILTIWIINAVVDRRRLLNHAWMNRVIVVFCLICIAGLLNSAESMGSGFPGEQLNSLKRWLSPMLLFFPIANGNFSRSAIKRMVITTLIMIAVITVWTLIDYNDFGFHNINEDSRVGGPFGVGSENDLAAFFIYYPILLLAVALYDRSIVRRIMMIAVFGLSLIPLIYSLSRGAYIGMIAVILFLAVVKFRWMLILIIVGALTYTSWTPEVVQQRFERTQVMSNELVGGRVPGPNDSERTLEASSAQRVRIWRGAMNLIATHPITGVGYNVFPYAIPTYANMEWGMDAHNMYLRVTAELGVFGLLFMLLLLLVPFVTIWRVYRTSGDRFIRGWMLGCMACICGILIVNIFGSRFVREELVGLYWVNVALTYAYVFLRRQRLERAKSGNAVQSHEAAIYQATASAPAR